MGDVDRTTGLMLAGRSKPNDGLRCIAGALALVSVPALLGAQSVLFRSPAFEVTATSVRQGRFNAEALGRDTIVSTYPRAAREVHFKFALNGRDNEFAPGTEHTINLRPLGGRVVTALYTFGVAPTPALPRPEDAPDGEDGAARVTVRLDLRHVKREITARGSYTPPQGPPIASLDRVTVIGDTGPLVWEINAVRAGAPQELIDSDGDGIYETTLEFRTEYLRPLDMRGRAIWVRSRDLSMYPELRSPEPLLDAVYRLSLEELTQLVRDDGALAAGAKWPGVWTRDISLSALLSLAIVVPDAVRISLMQKVDARGRIIQDTGTGGSWPISTDRMTWALAAWEVYAVTGDREWLRTSYDIIKRSAEADAHAARDPATGLFRGESSFLDWREQSYPRWMQPADIYQSQALGTNAVHFGAYRVLVDMGRALDRPAAEIAVWERTADGIRSGLARDFWMPGLKRHAQFTYGRVAMSRSPRYEALGEALIALLGASDPRERTSAALAAPVVPFGTPTFWPFIAGEPFYHNATIWPFVTAYATWAAAANPAALGQVAQGLAALTRGSALFLTNKENLVAETGHFEGTALNSDRQLWSVAGTLAMQYRVLFGMHFERERLVFRPVVPEAWAGMRELRGVRYRGATLTVRVRGWGHCDGRATLDGAPIAQMEIPATIEGAHLVEIDLDGCHVDPIALMPGRVESRFAPATPVATLRPVRPNRSGLTGGVADGMESLIWDAIPGATHYVVHRDGVPIRTISVTTYAVRRSAVLAEYQVQAVDTLGVGSFLSEPVRVVSAAGERLLAPGRVVGDSSVRLERESPSVTLSFSLVQSGRFALDALYSNGSGPINTEDKAAVRTADVDGRVVGVLVMPQRGAGNWGEQGYSNALVVTLPAGRHSVTLRWDPLDENMNGSISTAILHRVRVTHLPEAKRP